LGSSILGNLRESSFSEHIGQESSLSRILKSKRDKNIVNQKNSPTYSIKWVRTAGKSHSGQAVKSEVTIWRPYKLKLDKSATDTRQNRYRNYAKWNIVFATVAIHFRFRQQIFAIRTGRGRFRGISRRFSVFSAFGRLPHHRFDFFGVLDVHVSSVLGLHQHGRVLESGVLESGSVTLDNC
jgi:hypothetical protein